MATLNLTKIGALVKVEFTGSADRYVSSNSEILFYMPSDGTAKVHVSIAGQGYDIDAITDIQVEGIAVTNQADFETQIATVFPEANGGSGSGSADLSDYYTKSQTDAKDNARFEVAATFSAIAGGTTKRLVYVSADETNNGDISLYVHNGTSLKLIQTLA